MCPPDCQLAAMEISHKHATLAAVKPDSLTSVYCTPGLDNRSHRHCEGSRAGIWPCYCPCHFPTPTVPSWVCHHAAGRTPEVTDGRAHTITECQRQAIADFHRTHPKIKRVHPNALP